MAFGMIGRAQGVLVAFPVMAGAYPPLAPVGLQAGERCFMVSRALVAVALALGAVIGSSACYFVYSTEIQLAREAQQVNAEAYRALATPTPAESLVRRLQIALKDSLHVEHEGSLWRISGPSNRSIFGFGYYLEMEIRTNSDGHCAQVRLRWIPIGAL